jgi:2-hydroxychromene-2-carboxylate isomerase
MAAPIDFYFDFSSPYGYLAAQKIEALAAKHGREVDWHPVLLGVIFKETGSAPLTMVPLKGDYSRRDFERSARFHGIRDSACRRSSRSRARRRRGSSSG